MIVFDGSEFSGLVYVFVCGIIGILGFGYLFVLEGVFFYCIVIFGLFGMLSYVLICLNFFIFKFVDIRLMYRIYLSFYIIYIKKFKCKKEINSMLLSFKVIEFLLYILFD